jgi:hypothetical protein
MKWRAVRLKPDITFSPAEAGHYAAAAESSLLARHYPP